MSKVAFIVADVFEDSEFSKPYEAVREAGHEAVIIGVESGTTLTGKNGSEITSDAGIDSIDPKSFDALVIPGGYSPDKLRTNAGMVALTRAMVEGGRPTAVICHGPWMLAEADVLRGRRVTSWASVRTDLVNAGADWTDAEVVEDGNLITSRSPKDLPAFCSALLRQLNRQPAPA